MDNKRTLTVLVVDDNPAVRAVICETLRMEGFDVTAAANGQEAVDAVAVAEPDLILMDSIMPVLSGPAAIGILRSRGVRSKIIALSGIAADAASGADAILLKPLSPEELFRTIEQLGL
jgi:CheY-like chemotaxis protein